MRIIQISDTHISAAHPFFDANVAAVRGWLAAEHPDLIVITGDLAMDGAGDTADLAAAAAWTQGLPARVLSVPGNHDVGDTAAIKPSQTVDDARLAAYRAHLGPDRWQHDQDGWRLIGLNAMLLGTGHAEEEAQFAWLEGALATDAPVAVFLHKPLFIDAPSEPPRGYWTVTPEPRRRLLGLLATARVRLIASGHLHIHRELHQAGIDHVWCPAASFVCGDSQEDLGGMRRLGALVHDFGADRVTTRFVRPDGLEDLAIEPVQHILYPRPTSGQPA
jgi:3',5'-cyclic AMP phosphodiesterase CpdA